MQLFLPYGNPAGTEFSHLERRIHEVLEWTGPENVQLAVLGNPAICFGQLQDPPDVLGPCVDGCCRLLEAQDAVVDR